MFGYRRPIPGREFVEVYIKAYYLPETQLETWIYDHKVSGFCTSDDK